MVKIIPKIIPSLFLWGIFGYVVLQIPYPESITQANIIQLLSFFIPLFLAITLTLNIFLKNIFISTSLSLGLIFLMILKSLDSLNLVTGILTAIAVGLLASYFRKINLTKLPRIPRITRLRKGI
ncbi:hypothetical protein HYT18_03630 [Candidatus Microgenomates bacterium]|nr:hypothetical protein [Candidatus Microgenomates bacterium]